MKQVVDSANLALKVPDEIGTAALKLGTDLGGLSAMFLARADQSLCSSAILAQRGLSATR